MVRWHFLSERVCSTCSGRTESGFPALFSNRYPCRPLPTDRRTQSVTQPGCRRGIVEQSRDTEFMDNGSRPAEWHRIHQARESTAEAGDWL